MKTKYVLLTITMVLAFVLGWVLLPQDTAKTQSSIIYVREGASGDGSSWANAYGDLESALSTAGSPCEIWVSSGTYFPTAMAGGTGSSYQTFQMKNDVEIYGGFPSTGSPTWNDRDWRLNTTILSGDIGTPGDNSDNCYNVFYHPSDLALNSSAILDGFTITGGSADTVVANSLYREQSGGGMYNSSSSPTIRNCSFVNNYALDWGGGIFNKSSSSPVIINCTFSNNSSTSGAGIFNYGSSPAVINCAFSQNTREAICNSWSSPNVVNSVFWGNTSGPPFGGAGMFSSYGHPTVVNSIFWANTPNDISSMNNADLTITYCNIQQGYPGTGNICANPEFLNPGSADFHLASTSPCVNSGTNYAIPPELTEDFEGDSRILDVRVDMGVDETPYQTPLVNTRVASDVADTSAVLNGTLVDMGGSSSLDCTFVWGTSSGGPYPNETPAKSMNIPGGFKQKITGLTEGVTCYYQAKANGDGTDYGAEMSFTPGSFPQIPGGWAFLLVPSNPSNKIYNLLYISSGTTIRVNNWDFRLNDIPNVLVDIVHNLPPGWTDMGSEDMDDGHISLTALGSDFFLMNGYQLAEFIRQESTLEMIYDYIDSGFLITIDGTAKSGEWLYDNDHLLTEYPLAIVPGTPITTTGSVSGIGTTGATLNGSLDDLGISTRAATYFQYGTLSGSYPYSTTINLTESTGTFSEDIDGLSEGTTYYYRTKSVGDGAGYGDEVIFSTLSMIDVEIHVSLQDSGTPSRPEPTGWEVPLNVGFYPPGSATNTLLNPGSALYYYSQTGSYTITMGGTRSVVTVGPVNPGTYDITVDSETTLLNVKRGVGIW